MVSLLPALLPKRVFTCCWKQEKKSSRLIQTLDNIQFSFGKSSNSCLFFKNIVHIFSTFVIFLCSVPVYSYLHFLACPNPGVPVFRVKECTVPAPSLCIWKYIAKYVQAPSRQSSSNPTARVTAGAPCTSSWFSTLLRASSKHCLQGLSLISLIPASSACKGTSWDNRLLPYSLALHSSIPQLPCPNRWAWALAEKEGPPGLQHHSSSMAYPGPGEGGAQSWGRQFLSRPLALLLAQKAAQLQLQLFFPFISFPAILRGLVDMSHYSQNCQKEGNFWVGSGRWRMREKMRREKTTAGQNMCGLPTSLLGEPQLPTLSNMITC